MTTDLPRRAVVAGIAALPLLATTARAGESPKDANETPGNKTYALGDIVLGNKDAKVTVIEYASFTCPHCASFHVQVYPKLKAEYIDTGKVKFIVREVFFHRFGLWAAMTARCGGKEGYYGLVDALMKSQREWKTAKVPGNAIMQIGRRAGLSEEMINACMSDKDYARKLIGAYQKNAEADGVRSTPTFLINGKKYTNMSFDEFKNILDPMI